MSYARALRSGAILGVQVLLLVLVAGLASAIPRTFTLGAASGLTLSGGMLVMTPGGTFVTELRPQPFTDFSRGLTGTVVADDVTGAVLSADIMVAGAPLLGDQIMIDRRGNPRDSGDFSLIALGFHFDDVGQATLISGQVEFDLSFGSFREASTAPISLVGETTLTMNNGLPPTLSTMGSTLMLQFPVSMQFQALTVISSGDATFDLNGTVFATAAVPEPSPFLLLSVALIGASTLRRRARRSQ